MEELRIQKACAQMKARGIDQMIITSPSNLLYLTGCRLVPMERLAALVLNQDGSSTIYANEIVVAEQSLDTNVISFPDTADGIAELSKGICSSGTVAVDRIWQAHFLLRLMERRPKAAYRYDCTILEELRMIKDDREIDALRTASAMSDQVVTQLHASVREGMTEQELSELIRSLYLQACGTNGGAMIQIGANSADPHCRCGTGKLRPGDGLLVDTGVSIRHYNSDMTRTAFFRFVPEEMEKIYSIVLEANLAAISAVRPGAPLHTVDDAARSLITEAGYGPRFIHRTGHHIGLDLHEPPDVSSTAQIRMEPGMVFSVEPGIYLPGVGGIRIEDLVLVTESGCEVLNHMSKELKILN